MTINRLSLLFLFLFLFLFTTSFVSAQEEDSSAIPECEFVLPKVNDAYVVNIGDKSVCRLTSYISVFIDSTGHTSGNVIRSESKSCELKSSSLCQEFGIFIVWFNASQKSFAYKLINDIEKDSKPKINEITDKELYDIVINKKNSNVTTYTYKDGVNLLNPSNSFLDFESLKKNSTLENNLFLIKNRRVTTLGYKSSSGNYTCQGRAELGSSGCATIDDLQFNYYKSNKTVTVLETTRGIRTLIGSVVSGKRYVISYSDNYDYLYFMIYVNNNIVNDYIHVSKISKELYDELVNKSKESAVSNAALTPASAVAAQAPAPSAAGTSPSAAGTSPSAAGTSPSAAGTAPAQSAPSSAPAPATPSNATPNPIGDIYKSKLFTDPGCFELTCTVKDLKDAGFIKYSLKSNITLVKAGDKSSEYPTRSENSQLFTPKVKYNILNESSGLKFNIVSGYNVTQGTNYSMNNAGKLYKCNVPRLDSVYVEYLSVTSAPAKTFNLHWKYKSEPAQGPVPKCLENYVATYPGSGSGAQMIGLNSGDDFLNSCFDKIGDNIFMKAICLVYQSTILNTSFENATDNIASGTATATATATSSGGGNYPTSGSDNTTSSGLRLGTDSSSSSESDILSTDKLKLGTN